ncbi:hypothetical protein CW745_03420 [Psychromonas sp. psych-6C06]|uniref:SpoIIE family protein phosphatase n=1 Tax=Psychromonas sp. psych-6C06 TaxID=2058089 RepID=UPI000C338079|nr:SpoIIE family protein phosphatase [Psychromonas sp. psych-6C06]PKF62496.1 hypothetical protein CW745_03420 [Psychromonas sp. psych-6C06]
MMETIIIEIFKPVSENIARECRHALQESFAEQIPNTIASRILLCVSEAVTNLVEHNKPAPTDIGVRFLRITNGWQLTVFDNGQTWDPTANLNDDLLTEFSDIESGRGIALLHAQSDAIKYQASSKFHAFNQLQLFWSQPLPTPKQTILLVEDNNSLRLLYQAYLDKKYHIVTASNGYEALDKLNQQHIDLVLSDIKMPQMNGLSLRKKINQQTKKALLPFVFLTAQDDDLVQQQASQLGIDDYLIKPVNKARLLTVIARVLGRTQQVYHGLTERIDQQISDSLQPTLPTTCDGWNIQVATRNTGSGGGDLLLHHRLENMTQLLLTDIMGHDDSAKFFSHAYGGYLHGLLQSVHSTQHAGTILEQLSNCAAQDKLLSQVTLTCCSVQLLKEGIISFASAGHPAPLLISEQGISTVEVSGMLPGLMENTQYQSHQITLRKGQRIALFTDGLFESAENNQARQQLQQQISAELLATRQQPIAQAIQQVMSRFDQLTGAQPSDDTLLLLLEPIQY